MSPRSRSVRRRAERAQSTHVGDCYCADPRMHGRPPRLLILAMRYDHRGQLRSRRLAKGCARSAQGSRWNGSTRHRILGTFPTWHLRPMHKVSPHQHHRLAADQAGERAQPVEHALAGKRRGFARAAAAPAGGARRRARSSAARRASPRRSHRRAAAPRRARGRGRSCGSRPVRAAAATARRPSPSRRGGRTPRARDRRGRHDRSPEKPPWAMMLSDCSPR